MKNGNNITLKTVGGIFGTLAVIGVPFIYISAIKTDVAVGAKINENQTENIKLNTIAIKSLEANLDKNSQENTKNWNEMRLLLTAIAIKQGIDVEKIQSKTIKLIETE